MDTIRSAAETEDLPIMICGNKIDLRGEKEELGFKVRSAMPVFYNNDLPVSLIIH